MLSEMIYNYYFYSISIISAPSGHVSLLKTGFYLYLRLLTIKVKLLHKEKKQN